MRVLITGAGSYLGGAILGALRKQGVEADELDVRGALPEKAFQGYDRVVHVAGIAHRKETPENRPLYEQVNHRLAVEIARAAKAQGVRQFVFFSTMSVYGKVTGRITADTQPDPKNAYGASKWAAEQEIAALADEHFAVAVLRPPMIYGKGCRGNYQSLRRLILKTPMFPRCGNQRSMLYVGNLCLFMGRLLESGQGGLYFPQNREYVSTDGLAREIAKANGKKLWQPGGWGGLLRALGRKNSLFGKVFGSLTYDQAMSECFRGEEEWNFASSIALTEEQT